MSELARQASPAQTQVHGGGPAAVVRIYYRARCMECAEVDVILTASVVDGVGNSQVEAANRQLVDHRARTGHAIRTMEENMAPRVLTVAPDPTPSAAEVIRGHLRAPGGVVDQIKSRTARRARAASFDSSGEGGVDG